MNHVDWDDYGNNTYYVALSADENCDMATFEDLSDARQFMETCLKFCECETIKLTTVNSRNKLCVLAKYVQNEQNEFVKEV